MEIRINGIGQTRFRIASSLRFVAVASSSPTSCAIAKWCASGFEPDGEKFSVHSCGSDLNP